MRVFAYLEKGSFSLAVCLEKGSLKGSDEVFCSVTLILVIFQETFGPPVACPQTGAGEVWRTSFSFMGEEYKNSASLGKSHSFLLLSRQGRN